MLLLETWREPRLEKEYDDHNDDDDDDDDDDDER